MKYRSFRIAAMVLALAAAPVASIAASHDHGPGQPPPPGGMMGHGMMDHGMMPLMGMMGMGNHVEGSLAFVRAELKITEAQSALWEKFADAYRATAKPGEMRGPDAHEPAMPPMRMDLPARLEMHQKMLSERLEKLNAIKGPLLALYAALSDEQKKSADMLMGMLMMH